MQLPGIWFKYFSGTVKTPGTQAEKPAVPTNLKDIDMSIIDDIRIAQRDAGEAAVIRHLEAQGLSKPDPELQKADTHFIQPKITGYRQLSQAEVDLMNEGKALAEQCGTFIAKLRKHGDIARPSAPAAMPDDQSFLLLDQRWISIGTTSLQQGFMAVIRGIAQPTSF